MTLTLEFDPDLPDHCDSGSWEDFSIDEFVSLQSKVSSGMPERRQNRLSCHTFHFMGNGGRGLSGRCGQTVRVFKALLLDVQFSDHAVQGGRWNLKSRRGTVGT